MVNVMHAYVNIMVLKHENSSKRRGGFGSLP